MVGGVACKKRSDQNADSDRPEGERETPKFSPEGGYPNINHYQRVDVRQAQLLRGVLRGPG